MGGLAIARVRLFSSPAWQAVDKSQPAPPLFLPRKRAGEKIKESSQFFRRVLKASARPIPEIRVSQHPARTSGGENRVEPPGLIEGAQLFVAPDNLAVNENFRHRAPAARHFDHLLTQLGVVRDVDLLERNAFAFEKRLGADAEGAIGGGIELNFRHVRPPIYFRRAELSSPEECNLTLTASLRSA